jgi:hypothetical protein
MVDGDMRHCRSSALPGTFSPFGGEKDRAASSVVPSPCKQGVG